MKDSVKNLLMQFGLYFPLLTLKTFVFQHKKYKHNKKDISDKMKLLSAFINKGALCFDVGANVGQMTEVFLKLGATVIAIEPQKPCQKILTSKFGGKITLIKEGLGPKEEQREFHIADSINISSFSTEWINAVKESGRFQDQQWNKKEIIQLTTLDKLISKYGTPDFCKIDVEGFELEVLKGLTAPLKVLSIEYTTPERIGSTTECLTYLNSIGKITCNYCTGSEMKLILKKWKSCEEMIQFINTKEFTDTSNGDIYVSFI